MTKLYSSVSLTLVSCLCLCASFFLQNSVTMASPIDSSAKAPKPWTWNSILNAKGIFPADLDPIKTNSKEPADVVAELRTILDNDDNLKIIYDNYQKDWEKTDRDIKVHGVIFKDQLLSIAEHNVAADNGKHLWWKGVNQFTDQTDAERRRHTGGKIPMAGKTPVDG